jgi:hypothetical protein
MFYAMFCDGRFLWLVWLYVMFMVFAPGCYIVPCLCYIHFAALTWNAVNALHITLWTFFC